VQVLPRLRPSDLLMITADHGNDPSTPSTDHSREFVPVLITGGPTKAGPSVRRGFDIGTRQSFADLGQTLAENFGIGPLAHGTSFLEDIVVHHP
jgi:phosphopentomutase